MPIKSLTPRKRVQLVKFYLEEMSPTHDSFVPCEPDGKCPACGGMLSYSLRGWGFCRITSCRLAGKMQRLRAPDRERSKEELASFLIEKMCVEKAGRLIWLPGEEK
jgi:hypothetical protein